MEPILAMGLPPTKTFGLPGSIGKNLGLQGAGVKTPWFMDVKLATAGFCKDEHMPHGAISDGESLFTLATGFPPAFTWLVEITVRVVGAEPMEHVPTQDEIKAGLGILLILFPKFL